MAVPKQNNDRWFCWEQIMQTNPLFRISREFAPDIHAGYLLPLYALFSALEQLGARSVEEEVGRKKLEWWRSECLVRDPAGSDHPILKELTRNNPGRLLDRRLLAKLFDSAEARLDRQSPADVGELEALCRLTGKPQCVLELDLASVGCGARQTESAAPIGLAQLFRESTGQGGANRYWWLPLNLLARHGISRSALEQDVDGPSAQAVFRDVLRERRAWRTAPNGANEGPEHDRSAVRHLAVHTHLQQRALKRLEKVRPSEYPAALKRLGPREVFAAWRAARAVNRR